jgi:hypothetical protein
MHRICPRLRKSSRAHLHLEVLEAPATINFSGGQVVTMSEYVMAVSGLGTGDKPLQIGFLSPSSTGFNAGFSFISARILGNNSVEFQSANGGAATSIHNTKPTGTIKTGDWLELIFTTQETASGSFKGTFSLIDYGPTGVGSEKTVLAPVSYSVSGLTNLGTASAVFAGFRTATSSAFKGHVRFDNLVVDPPSLSHHSVRLHAAVRQHGHDRHRHGHTDPPPRQVRRVVHSTRIRDGNPGRGHDQ